MAETPTLWTAGSDEPSGKFGTANASFPLDRDCVPSRTPVRGSLATFPCPPSRRTPTRPHHPTGPLRKEGGRAPERGTAWFTAPSLGLAVPRSTSAPDGPRSRISSCPARPCGGGKRTISRETEPQLQAEFLTFFFHNDYLWRLSQGCHSQKESAPASQIDTMRVKMRRIRHQCAQARQCSRLLRTPGPRPCLPLSARRKERPHREAVMRRKHVMPTACAVILEPSRGMGGSGL
jgi:hypothetical protein